MVFRCASIDGINYLHQKQADNIRFAKEFKNFDPALTENRQNVDSDALDGEAKRKPKRHQRKVTESNLNEIVDDANKKDLLEKIKTQGFNEDLETKVWVPDFRYNFRYSSLYTICLLKGPLSAMSRQSFRCWIF